MTIVIMVMNILKVRFCLRYFSPSSSLVSNSLLMSTGYKVKYHITVNYDGDKCDIRRATDGQK